MHAGWWTVMTMTTVGFGDIIPRTMWGAVLGYVTMLIGVLAVALPISVLSSTFSAKYAQFQQEDFEVRVAHGWRSSFAPQVDAVCICAGIERLPGGRSRCAAG